MIIEENKLLDITGGAIKSIGYIILLGVGGFISLLAGIIEGYTNPNKCNK